MLRLCFTLLLLLPAVSASEPEARLLEDQLRWRHEFFGERRWGDVALSTERPAGVPPQGLAEGFYGSAPCGLGPPLLFAVDPGQGRFWIDRKRDGTFDGLSPLTWRPVSGKRADLFELEVPLSVLIEGETEPLEVTLHFELDRFPNPPTLRMAAELHRYGKLVAAGRERDAVLVDGNGDLRFGGHRQDGIYLDVDGDGLLETRPGSHEWLRLQRQFRMRGEALVPLAAPGLGWAVELRRAEGEAPRVQRPWSALKAPPAGTKADPGHEPLKTLAARFRNERRRKEPPFQRIKTVMQIGALGTPAAFEQLMSIYDEAKEPLVRLEAVRAAGYVEYAAFAPRIVAILGDSTSRAVKISAIETLHRMDAEGRERVLAALLRGTFDYELFDAGAAHLAYVGTQSARKALIDLAGQSAYAALQTRAYYFATRYFSQPPPLDLMLAVADTKYPELQALALEDIHQQGHDEAHTLARRFAQNVHSREIALRIVDILGSVGDGPAVKTILPFAVERWPEVRQRLRYVLSPVRDPDGVAAIAGFLDHASPAVRKLAAQIAGAVPGEATSRGLLRRLEQEQETTVRIAVIEALGRQREPRAESGILAAARKGDGPLRDAAVRSIGRISSRSDAARAFLVGQLLSTDWRARVRALEAAGLAGDTLLAPDVVKSLGHKVWQVRLTAAESLGRIRVPLAIEPLIRRLEDRLERKRVQTAAATSLVRITGVQLYDLAGAWRKWWTDNQRSFRVPAQPAEPRRRKHGSSVITFYGLPVESDRVIFVIDKSGSMQAPALLGKSGSRLLVAKAQVLDVVRRLPDTAWGNAIFFESKTFAWRSKLTRLDSVARKSLRGWVRRRRPKGGTELFLGLNKALRDKQVDTIFVLSDGEVQAGTPILKLVQALNGDRRIAIHCVAIGTDSLLLRHLAAQNGGRYTRR